MTCSEKYTTVLAIYGRPCRARRWVVIARVCACDYFMVVSVCGDERASWLRDHVGVSPH